ncbi:phage-related baseplate protein [Novosphingobium sp. Rr 2-17]|uniref:GPW/gp25 family protein n=1 Tax=Novosphingobium sp. Rr 2-17 TaxID=555793 RepID=UPI00026985A5|nr:GPW/gp25 family protein [Novosphingobium sp. Rr 2-17]EIZ77777.1 phage-related baseplate protein [Novosphingobium sp. Rr 2-17]
MAGMSRTTGAVLDGVDHIAQSVRDILGTRKGSRPGRREYGSDVPDLLDQPLNGKTVLKIYAATALALSRWEDRIRVKRVSFAVGDTQGSGTITTEAVRTDTATSTSTTIVTSL